MYIYIYIYSYGWETYTANYWRSIQHTSKSYIQSHLPEIEGIPIGASNSHLIISNLTWKNNICLNFLKNKKSPPKLCQKTAMWQKYDKRSGTYVYAYIYMIWAHYLNNNPIIYLCTLWFANLSIDLRMERNFSGIQICIWFPITAVLQMRCQVLYLSFSEGLFINVLT